MSVVTGASAESIVQCQNDLYLDSSKQWYSILTLPHNQIQGLQTKIEVRTP